MCVWRETSASITTKRDFSHLTHKFKLSLIRHSSVFIYIWRERVETSNLKTESRQTVKWPLILAATQRQNDLPVCFSLSATKEIHKRIQVCTSVFIKKIWKNKVKHRKSFSVVCWIFLNVHINCQVFCFVFSATRQVAWCQCLSSFLVLVLRGTSSETNTCITAGFQFCGWFFTPNVWSGV